MKPLFHLWWRSSTESAISATSNMSPVLLVHFIASVLHLWLRETCLHLALISDCIGAGLSASLESQGRKKLASVLMQCTEYPVQR